MRRNKLMALFAAVMMTVSSFGTVSYAQTQANEWTSFRGNSENMGVTSYALPKSAGDATEKWTRELRLVEELFGWEMITPAMPPIIAEGNMYTALADKVYKISKEDGSIIEESEPLAGRVGYSSHPMGYGDGMLFVPIAGGRIQALSAETLESLWISAENADEQINAPITYENGRVFVGTVDSTWNESAQRSFFCLEATDEDEASGEEVKDREWEIDNAGGFYWSGSYATDSYVIIGGEDGETGSDTAGAVLYSINPEDGSEIDRIEGIYGDIRSSVCYDSGSDRVYFATKGGTIYQVKVNADGTFDDAQTKSINLGNQITATPVVYDGLLYIGVSSGSGFEAEYYVSGSAYAVINTEDMTLAAATAVPGYAQGSAILSDAYKDDGKLYLYTTYNSTPGGIYVIEVIKDTQTGEVSLSGRDLFVPTESMQNYCMCSLICDDGGDIYYTNDSGYIMAVREKDSSNSVTAFKIGDSFGSIDEAAKTISVTVPNNFNLLSLVPEITVSAGAAVSPASGVQIDFSAPVTYTVTAENGETQTYTVTVTKQESWGGTSGGVTEMEPENITVCVSVEKLAIDGGFIVAPTLVDTTTEVSASDILCEVLSQNGISYDADESLGFYLKGIEDGDDDADIPAYIAEYLGAVGSRKRSGWLCEYDYSDKSGWMYTVNGKIPNKGADRYKMKDGDVLRWQFSVCAMGADIRGGTKGLTKTADKDDLLYELAELNSARTFDELMGIGTNYEKYLAAVDVAEKIDSTQQEVNSALRGLRNLDEEEPEEVPVEEKTEEEVKEQVKEETPEETATVFADTEHHWAKEFINILAGKELISGKQDGKFMPDDNITRAEYVAILFRMSGEAAHGKHTFSDVAESDWFSDSIIWAVSNGIVNGVSETEFAPNENITREQMAVILGAYIDCFGIELEITSEAEKFSDREEISVWARDSVTKMQTVGLINGRGDGSFAPKANATRAEAARVLSGIIK